MTRKEFNLSLIWAAIFVLLFEGLALFVPRPYVWFAWLVASAMIIFVHYLTKMGKI